MKSTTTVRKYVIAGSLSLSLSPAMFAQTHNAPPMDWHIEAQVQKAIANDHIFVGSSMMSSVNQGVVKLTGNVRSESEKEYASSDLCESALGTASCTRSTPRQFGLRKTLLSEWARRQPFKK